MAIVKAKYLSEKRSGGTYANNALRYALERDADQKQSHQEGQERIAFDGSRDAISASDALAEIENSKGNYYYHIILNAGDGHSEVDLQEWTRDTMTNLENTLDVEGKADNFKWVAVEHDDHANHDHIHVVMVSDIKLDKDALNELRDFTTESFDSRKELIQSVQQGLEQDYSKDQSISVEAAVTQLTSAVPSQSVTIASASEDNVNKANKRKQKKERGQDESW